MANRKGNITNHTGAGGFGDHPEHRGNGKWKAENSQMYCLNMFLNMTESDFLDWGKKHPKNKRTVAQVIAYERVMKARTSLDDYKVVSDRTEGKPVQPIAGDDEKPLRLDINISKLLEKVYGEAIPKNTSEMPSDS